MAPVVVAGGTSGYYLVSCGSAQRRRTPIAFSVPASSATMETTGILLLWNDIDPEVEVEYNRWHSREHVPERVSVPGIRAARRYARADDGPQRYLSVYDLDSTAVLSSRPYTALVERPTPWSQKMRPHFCNMARCACRRVASAGAGVGAWLLALRVAKGKPDKATRAAALDAIIELEGVLAADWGLVDARVPGIAWNAGGAPPSAFDEVVLAQATDREALAASRRRIEALVRAAAGSDAVDPGPEYALLHLVGK